jgi:hypothetical protein
VFEIGFVIQVQATTAIITAEPQRNVQRARDMIGRFLERTKRSLGEVRLFMPENHISWLEVHSLNLLLLPGPTKTPTILTLSPTPFTCS